MNSNDLITNHQLLTFIRKACILYSGRSNQDKVLDQRVGKGLSLPIIHMDKLKTIRWQQRFQNLDKAYSQLKRGLAIEHPSAIEQQGIIQIFEFTFELSWKTLAPRKGV